MKGVLREVLKFKKGWPMGGHCGVDVKMEEQTT